MRDAELRELQQQTRLLREIAIDVAAIRASSANAEKVAARLRARDLERRMAK